MVAAAALPRARGAGFRAGERKRRARPAGGGIVVAAGMEAVKVPDDGHWHPLVDF